MDETHRQLLLLRHAKSSWSKTGLQDHDRPLSRRGQQAAPEMGRYLARSNLRPDLVLCSTANRARTTWRLVAKALGGPEVPVKEDRALYHAAPSELMEQVRNAPDEARRIVLVGHNPGMESLAQHLAGDRSDEDKLMQLQDKYPTAGLALFQVDAPSWAGVIAKNCTLIDFVTPRELQLRTS
ncbi:MAG: histidine phosphatase family protein [Rhodospirillales bacterium]|nr:histidine phosphatase family protein [Rhodospirillales bacterium]